MSEVLSQPPKLQKFPEKTRHYPPTAIKKRSYTPGNGISGAGAARDTIAPIITPNNYNSPFRTYWISRRNPACRSDLLAQPAVDDDGDGTVVDKGYLHIGAENTAGHGTAEEGGDAVAVMTV